MTIAITIPVAFLLGQYFNKDKTLWSMFYGIMGLIGSAVALDIARKCNKDGEDEQTVAAIGVAVYGALGIWAVISLMRRQKAKWN